MHEYALVAAIVDHLLDQLRALGEEQVLEVRLACANGVSEEAVLQAYQATTAGSPLEGVPVRIDTVVRTLTCGCGRTREATGHELVGRLFVCAACGAVLDGGDAPDLRVVELLLPDPPPPG